MEIYNTRFYIGTDILLIGLYLASIKNFSIHGNIFEATDGIASAASLCICNHACRDGTVWNNRFIFEAASTGHTKGSCGAIRNTASHADAYTDNVTWNNNYLYKSNQSNQLHISFVILICFSPNYIDQYYNKDNRDQDKELYLCKIWEESALSLRRFNKDLADRCLLKGAYWNGVGEMISVKENRIKIEDMRKGFQALFDEI